MTPRWESFSDPSRCLYKIYPIFRIVHSLFFPLYFHLFILAYRFISSNVQHIFGYIYTTNRMYFSNVICQLGWHGTDIVTVFCLEWCIVPLTLHSFYMLLVKTFNADLHNQFPFRFQAANFLLSQRVSRDRKMSLRWLGRDGWICIRMQRSYPFRRGSTLLKLLSPEKEITGRLSGNHRRSYLCLIVFCRFAQRQS